MTKLLTICIPTYKRPITLRRCIISVVEQIQRYGLEGQVQIYVTNDASPDNTAQVLEEFKALTCFNHVNREVNLGMSSNIKCMLEEALLGSTYQLIITDDDYLQPDTLDSLVKYLADLLAKNREVPLIWTPRYSYTENGKLYCVVCRSFQKNTLILPSIRNAGRYMFNGFVLSGLVVKSKDIDFSLWHEFIDNAFFPVIVTGEIIMRKPSLYCDLNLVHHTVLNECHWEDWGRSEAEINLRLFVDFINSYAVIGKRIKPVFQAILFYLSAFSSVSLMMNSLLISSVNVFRLGGIEHTASSGGLFRLSDSESAALLNISRVSFSKIEPPSRILFFAAEIRILLGCLFKMAAYKILSYISIDRIKAERRNEAYLQYRQRLANVAFLMRWSR